MMQDQLKYILPQELLQENPNISDLFCEIDRVDFSRDSSCIRALSTYIVNLSEKQPQEFLLCLSHLFGYLEQDSYAMRNASLTIITNLIIKVIHQNEEEKTLRDELLDILLSHIRDITGYTRSKALSLWCTLAENKCIPNAYIVPATSAAVGRLLDKSCLVRKNALRFIICILSYNPYSGKLLLKVFLERYQTEKATLEKLLNEEEDIVETLSQSSLLESITSETDPEEVHPCLKIKNLALVDESAVETQRRKVIYLQDSIAFTKQIHRAIPIVTEMLYSKNITDIQEAIDFFVHCHDFGIKEALIGLKKMIMLINVQEKTIKDTVFAAYKRIFFESSRHEARSNLDSLVVQNFINFVQAASIGECIALEAILTDFLEKKEFTNDMERELWARFTKTRPNTTDEESIAAIQIIGMLATTQPDIINHNLPLCVEHGLAGDGCSDHGSRLIRETCIAIRKSIPRKIEDKRRFMRLSKDDEMFVRLSDILVGSLTNMASVHWFSMCDEALRFIFDKAENPEKICEIIYGRMAENLLKNSVQSNSIFTERNESPDFVYNNPSSTQSSSSNMELVHPIALSRFIHFLGDVALNLAVHLELNVLLELKIRNASKNNVSTNNISAHDISISSRRRSRRYGAQNNKSMEEEIGLGGAEGEDAEMEFIGGICDEEIVCGKNLLAKLSKVIIHVAMDPIRYAEPELKQASSLALAKYMMVSAKYCHDHLRLLFTILEKTKDHEIKINLLVAISDLCVRFPNQLDGWTGKIFDCLQSEQVSVRRAALKILSRLILSDILKAKDQISTMANLIVDDDEHIANHSRHFFLELSKKLNAIYNVLPDIISRLSDSKTGISEENFKIVMRFMFELIEKNQHIERLVDKLCGRFMDTDDERHWSDLAFCLSLLKYSEKSMAKLFDKFDCYKDKLCIDKVHESIASLIVNYRKTPNLKNEMKQLLDEFEAKIAKRVGEQNDDDKDPDNKQQDQTVMEDQNDELDEDEETQ